MWYFRTVPTVWYFRTVPTVWYSRTVPTVWYFRTVPTVWYFRTVPTVWYFITVPTVWYVLFYIVLPWYISFCSFLDSDILSRIHLKIINMILKPLQSNLLRFVSDLGQVACYLGVLRITLPMKNRSLQTITVYKWIIWTRMVLIKT